MSKRENEMRIAGKSILITGGGGFIGSNLTKKLINLGCKVFVIDHPSTDFWRLSEYSGRFMKILLDISKSSIDSLVREMPSLNYIFHLAARGVNSSEDDTIDLLETNIIGTYNMLQLGHRLEIDKFIYCGSCFEYAEGNGLSEDSPLSPISEYGASKIAAWHLVNVFYRRYGLPVVSIRPFTPFGPFEAPFRLIPYVIINLLEGLDVDLTLGEQTRDFVYINDLIEAFLAIGSSSIVGETFNACTGQATSVESVCKLIHEIIGGNSHLKFGSIPYRDTEMWSLLGDPTKAKNKLGWCASTKLWDGLDKTVQWFKYNRNRYPIYR